MHSLPRGSQLSARPLGWGSGSVLYHARRALQRVLERPGRPPAHVMQSPCFIANLGGDRQRDRGICRSMIVGIAVMAELLVGRDADVIAGKCGISRSAFRLLNRTHVKASSGSASRTVKPKRINENSHNSYPSTRASSYHIRSTVRIHLLSDRTAHRRSGARVRSFHRGMVGLPRFEPSRAPCAESVPARADGTPLFSINYDVLRREFVIPPVSVTFQRRCARYRPR